MKLFYILVGGSIMFLTLFINVAHGLLLALILVLIGGAAYDYFVLHRRGSKPYELPPHHHRQSSRSRCYREKSD